VDLFSLGSMGAPERLNKPIGTTRESHGDQHKEENMTRGAHPRVGCVNPRDISVGAKIGSFGCIESIVGRNGQLSVKIHEGV